MNNLAFMAFYSLCAMTSVLAIIARMAVAITSQQPLNDSSKHNNGPPK